jgi:xylulokinase
MNFDDMLMQVKRLLGGLTIPMRSVVAIGIASMGESGAVIDARGDVVTPIVSWYDARARPLAEALRERFSGPRWDLIGRPMRAKSSVAMLAYWARSGVPVRKWLGVAEIVAWALTGEMISEPSLAARTCAYDITRDRYEPEILEAIGAPDDVFPEVAAAGARAVPTVTMYARDVGLEVGTLVTVAGHDHSVGAAGAGAEPNDLVDSLGTSELLLRYSERLPLKNLLSIGAEAARAPGRTDWAITVCPAHSGALLAEMSDALGRIGHDRLGRMARSAGVPASVQFCRLEGKGSEARFSQLSPANTSRSAEEIGCIWAEAIEQLARAAATRADELDRIAGPAATTLIIGGGGRDRYWMSRKAAQAPKRMLRCSPIDEPVAYGAAALARPVGWGL